MDKKRDGFPLPGAPGWGIICLFGKSFRGENGKMNYRVMVQADYPGLYALWTNTLGMGLNTTDDSREGIEKYLIRNPSTSFVAEEDGIIVGAVMAGHDGRRGYIHHTAVLGGFRGMGVGKTLVSLAMDALEKEGIHKTALVLFAHNENGNAFWEHEGFTTREDLVYRNRNIHPLERRDT